jgi:hypothetical protein
MRKRSGETGPVVSMPRVRHLGEGRRDYLKLAQVKRAELFEDSATQKQLVFHDLRSTACTGGRSEVTIPSRSSRAPGTRRFSTTQRYLCTAEVLRDGFGDVFPSLASLMSGPPRPFRPVYGRSKMRPTTRNVGGADGTRNQGKTGAKGREESPNVTKRRERGTSHSTFATVRDVPDRAVSKSVEPVDPDEALKIAIKVALDAGDLDRVEALLSILKRAARRVYRQRS